MRAPGFTLVETLLVVALMLVFAALAAPALRARSVEAHLLGAGQAFRSEFRRAQSMAVRSNTYTAIRFERRGDEAYYGIYADGNGNGVLSSDIRSGHDPLVAGPFPLTGGAPGVRVAINPRTPAVPPERGLLEGDPIRFGPSDLLSFSPLGTATPGTFYLAGEVAQAAVRVNGGSARVRLMICRGGRWIER